MYVNDEYGDDIAQAFASIERVGGVDHPLAREHGTGVYLMREPRRPFAELWRAARAGTDGF